MYTEDRTWLVDGLAAIRGLKANKTITGASFF